MRAIGVDLGSRRIGVALSDSGGVLASPFDTVVRSGDIALDHRRILELAAEAEAEIIVVGLPLSLDGSTGPAAEGVLAEVERLRVATPIPVETYDERLTTVTATRLLRDGGVKGRAQRQVVDKVAASILLQAWLDGRRSGPPPPPRP